MCLLVIASIFALLSFTLGDFEQSSRVLRRRQPFRVLTANETDEWRHSVPKFTTPVFIPFALQTLYHETSTVDGEERKQLPFGSRTVMGIPSIVLVEKGLFQFTVPHLSDSEIVARIELYVFQKPPVSSARRTPGQRRGKTSIRTHLELYQRITTNERDQEVFRLVAVRRKRSDQIGWIVFVLPNDLADRDRQVSQLCFCLAERDSQKRARILTPQRTDLTRSLAMFYKPYMLLYIQQTKFSGDVQDFFQASAPISVDDRRSKDLWQPYQQFPNFGRRRSVDLTLSHSGTLNELRHRRLPRQANYRTASQLTSRTVRPRRTCSVRSMYVDFAQIGWDQWIISPTRYDARMCAGQCPFPLGQAFHPSNHAVVQMLMHHLNPNPGYSSSERIHRPCCVPRQLAALHVLYHDQDGRVLLKAYDDMIVESCGCS